MKIQNLKTLFYSLSALLLFSIVFVSCADQKENDSLKEEAVVISPEDIATRDAFILPDDLIDQGSEVYFDHIQNASAAELKLYSDNYVVSKYLANANVIKDVVENEPYGFNFAKIDFAQYLSETQIREVATLLNSDNSARNPCHIKKWRWWGWECVGNWCTGCNGGGCC